MHYVVALLLTLNLPLQWGIQQTANSCAVSLF